MHFSFTGSQKNKTGIMDNSSSHSGNLNKHPRKSYLAFEQNEKRYKCTICLQEFSSERLLRDHEHDHVTPFCHICSKMFKSAKLLRVHHQSYHSSSSSQQSPPHASSKSKETFNDDNICHDLTLHKIKEEPIDIVSEPEIENLLNHDSHHLSSPHHSDYYPEPSKSSLGIWRNFTETPTSAFLDHSSVPLPLGIKMEPVDSEHDQFDFIINEILKKPPGDGSSSSSRLSLVAEEISMHQNFWTQSDHQQDTWICDICSKTFTTKQILQRHRIATHDQNKVR